jgi:hypothetical protein
LGAIGDDFESDYQSGNSEPDASAELNSSDVTAGPEQDAGLPDGEVEQFDLISAVVWDMVSAIREPTAEGEADSSTEARTAGAGPEVEEVASVVERRASEQFEFFGNIVEAVASALGRPAPEEEEGAGERAAVEGSTVDASDSGSGENPFGMIELFLGDANPATNEAERAMEEGGSGDGFQKAEPELDNTGVGEAAGSPPEVDGAGEQLAAIQHTEGEIGAEEAVAEDLVGVEPKMEDTQGKSAALEPEAEDGEAGEESAVIEPDAENAGAGSESGAIEHRTDSTGTGDAPAIEPDAKDGEAGEESATTEPEADADGAGEAAVFKPEAESPEEESAPIRPANDDGGPGESAPTEPEGGDEEAGAAPATNDVGAGENDDDAANPLDIITSVLDQDPSLVEPQPNKADGGEAATPGGVPFHLIDSLLECDDVPLPAAAADGAALEDSPISLFSDDGQS